jgi:hypothetical protein
VLKLEFRAGRQCGQRNFHPPPATAVPRLSGRGAGQIQTTQKYRPQDWNQIEIVVQNGVARCTCNGELLEEALKVPETGPIGFEADRGLMEYRRIRLKESP